VDGLERMLLFKILHHKIAQQLSLAVVAGLRSQKVFLSIVSLPEIPLLKAGIQLYPVAGDGLPFRGEALAVLASIFHIWSYRTLIGLPPFYLAICRKPPCLWKTFLLSKVGIELYLVAGDDLLFQGEALASLATPFHLAICRNPRL
jgi:hypothetical protein